MTSGNGLRMRRVLFCSQTAAAVGGVPQRLTPLSESLPRLGWEPIVALAWGLGFHDPAVFRARHPDLTTVLLDGRSGTRTSRLLALEGAFASVRPDVVVPLHLFDALEAVRRHKCAGGTARLVFGIFEVSPAFLLDAERYAPVIDGFVANSRLLCDLLVKTSGADPKRVHHIPQGIPPPVSRREHREGPLRIGYFGRLSEDKRVLDLVDLCGELDTRGVGFSVLVVGDGPLDARLRERAEPWRQRGLFEVRPGTTRQRLYDDAYPTIDVSMLFSPREGSPNLPLESMAHGVVPVVADFQGRSHEGFLRHEENTLVFSVGDVAAAANCVERLYRDIGLRGRLAARGADEVRQRYGVEQMVTSWARVLEQVAEGPMAKGDVTVGPSPPSGRLEQWLGARGSEAIRRLLGRRFAHPDAGEWPYWGGWGDDELRRMHEAVQVIAAREGS